MKFSTEHRYRIKELDHYLLEQYGPRGWWPVTQVRGAPPVYFPGDEGRRVTDDEAVEIIVGAILTQNTAWTNVEQAIMRLTGSGLLNLTALATCDERLETAIQPSRYFNQKAKRLRDIAGRMIALGGIQALRNEPTDRLRERLLSWQGIGPETADAILCYAFNRPVFVVDAYTKRLFHRLNLPSGTYDEMQQVVHQSVPPSAAACGDLHARIVACLAAKEADQVIEALNSRWNRQKQIRKAFQRIPGVGEKIAFDLWEMGFRSPEELKGRNPEDLYRQLQKLKGGPVDRCMLYVFRSAVYFVSHTVHDPERLKWWNWKD